MQVVVYVLICFLCAKVYFFPQMAIITFLSDFGWHDHYVAAVKAKILNVSPNLNIVDITHNIELCNISHAAYVLGAIFRDFPQGTVHLVAVNSKSDEEKYIALKLEEHYFVGPDNGMYSLLSDRNPSVIVELQKDPSIALNFPEKNIMANAAVALASGRALYDIGKQLTSINQLKERDYKTSTNEIIGKVIHIDHYGNLITNIKLDVFNKIGNARQANIKIGSYNITGITEGYMRKDKGDCLCIFNSSGLLEILMILCNASKLLNIRIDSLITVKFTPVIED
jgi:S-adenosylmethionine hydrolase